MLVEAINVYTFSNAIRGLKASQNLAFLLLKLLQIWLNRPQKPIFYYFFNKNTIIYLFVCAFISIFAHD